MNINRGEMSEKHMTMYGKFTIKDDGAMVCANESFYNFLGTNSYYKMSELIHPEDKESFKNAIDNIETQEQSVVLRVKNIKNFYELFLFQMSYNMTDEKGEKYIDVNYFNLLFLYGRNEKLEKDIKKYRRLLCFEERYYFDFNTNTKEFIVYTYVNDKSLVIVRQNIDEWYRESIQRDDLSVNDRASLDNFYYNITAGLNDFIIEMSNKLFYETEKEELSVIKCSIVYNGGKKVFATGIISPKSTNENDMNTQFYITELKRDSATGLYNKNAVSEYVAEQIASNDKKNIYFVMMDIDEFKDINDTYGHMFGDVVIRRLAEILKSTIAHRGIVGRFGGDEFVMVIENVTGEELRIILKTVSKNLMWAFKETEKHLEITLSMGVVEYPTFANSYEEMLIIADKCLYLAKEKGKARFVLYDPKKHGELHLDENGKLVGNINDIVTNDEKSKLVSDIICKLSDYGTKDLSDYLELIRYKFNVDGIDIYAGENFEYVIGVGEYQGNIKSLLDVIEDNYFEIFKNDDVICIQSIFAIEKEYEKAFNLFVENGIKSSVQYFYNEQGKTPVLISYDNFIKNVKRGTYDKSMLRILSKMICKMISEEY